MLESGTDGLWFMMAAIMIFPLLVFLVHMAFKKTNGLSVLESIVSEESETEEVVSSEEASAIEDLRRTESEEEDTDVTKTQTYTVETLLSNVADPISNTFNVIGSIILGLMVFMIGSGVVIKFFSWSGALYKKGDQIIRFKKSDRIGQLALLLPRLELHRTLKNQNATGRKFMNLKNKDQRKDVFSKAELMHILDRKEAYDKHDESLISLEVGFKASQNDVAKSLNKLSKKYKNQPVYESGNAESKGFTLTPSVRETTFSESVFYLRHVLLYVAYTYKRDAKFSPKPFIEMLLSSPEREALLTTIINVTGDERFNDQIKDASVEQSDVMVSLKDQTVALILDILSEIRRVEKLGESTYNNEVEMNKLKQQEQKQKTINSFLDDVESISNSTFTTIYSVEKASNHVEVIKMDGEPNEEST